MKTRPFQFIRRRTNRPPQPGSQMPFSPASLALLFSVMGVVLLLLPEIWLSLAAFVWATSGLLHLAREYSLALWLICLPAGLWASWHVVVLAFTSATSDIDESAAG